MVLFIVQVVVFGPFELLAMSLGFVVAVRVIRFRRRVVPVTGAFTLVAKVRLGTVALVVTPALIILATILVTGLEMAVIAEVLTLIPSHEALIGGVRGLLVLLEATLLSACLLVELEVLVVVRNSIVGEVEVWTVIRRLVTLVAWFGLSKVAVWRAWRLSGVVEDGDEVFEHFVRLTVMVVERSRGVNHGRLLEVQLFLVRVVGSLRP